MEILTLTPEFGLEEGVLYLNDIFESESGREHRDALWDSGLRTYKLTCRYLTEATMNAIWDFYRARKGAYDPFLIKILHEYQVTDEIVASANGVTAQFALHHFPVDTTTNYSCTVNEVANTDFTLSNDFDNEISYINFSVIPSSGLIKVSYEYYFKVRFTEDTLSRQLVNYQLLHTGLTLQEVRWLSFDSPNGNSSSSSSSSISSSSSSYSSSSSSSSSSSYSSSSSSSISSSSSSSSSSST